MNIKTSLQNLSENIAFLQEAQIYFEEALEIRKRVGQLIGRNPETEESRRQWNEDLRDLLNRVDFHNRRGAELLGKRDSCLAESSVTR